MSKLMTVLGIILLAVGVALAVVGIVNPAKVQILGVSMDTAAILAAGGILAIGLGGVIAALERGVRSVAVVGDDMAEIDETSPNQGADAASEKMVPDVSVVEAPAVEPQPSRIRFPGFGRRIAATAGVAAAVEVAATSPPSVQDTIAALEKAKSDINNALGGVDTMSGPAGADHGVAEAASGDAAGDDAPALDGELYVIEEKVIRGRPARVLSDDTVEAETDEGWMRFENLEHLNEYLDAEGEDA